MEILSGLLIVPLLKKINALLPDKTKLLLVKFSPKNRVLVDCDCVHLSKELVIIYIYIKYIYIF